MDNSDIWFIIYLQLDADQLDLNGKCKPVRSNWFASNSRLTKIVFFKVANFRQMFGVANNRTDFKCEKLASFAK